MMVAMGRLRSFLASLPERLVRSVAALLGGTVHETAALALPRFARRSRLYEATAKNMLRITVEFVGGVVDASTVELSARPVPPSSRSERQRATPSSSA